MNTKTTKILATILLVLVMMIQPVYASINLSLENSNDYKKHQTAIERPTFNEFTGKIINEKAIPMLAENNNGVIPNHYIVILNDNVKDPKNEAAAMAKGYGMKVGITYSHALKGFAAVIPEHVLEKIRNDPRVKFIEEDQIVQAFNPATSKNIDQLLPLFPTPSKQTVPTGIDRIDAEQSTAGSIKGYKVDADIAIIDTGIDRNHPDLNVVRGATCFGAGFPGGGDDNGHGTHVAGIAAALNNDIGVVGVAPGAKLWAVKVLNFVGSGSISCVISGVDYVTANSDEIEVANLSLGCKCESQALKEAIRKSVESGIVYAVAAGNSAEDASNFEPANYSVDIDGVITVSALADSDGRCGKLGIQTSTGDTDDTFASFSNFGEPVTIAAPGVDIRSTHLSSSYMTLSGTSMATPHVSGAAAIIFEQPRNSDLSAAEIRNILVQNGVPQTKGCNTSLANGDGGFGGDIDGLKEPMLYVANTP